MFSADIQVDHQRAIFTLPKNGTSRKGTSVPLEDQRIEVAKPEDADKVSIAPHENGDPLQIVVQNAAGFTIPDGETSVMVDLVAKVDGSFGEGVSELTEPGAVVLRHPTATGFTVEATTEDTE